MGKFVNKKTVSGAIAVLLLLLIFFSRTLYTHNLPVVKAVLPESGKLNKTESGSGTAGWAKTENIYAGVGGIVASALVSEGERVQKGQPLFEMEYNADEIERKLKELKNTREKLNLDIKGLQLRIDKLERSVKDAQAEAYDQDEISNYELTQLLLDIQKAERDLARAQESYVSSPTSAAFADVDKAQYTLSSLLLKRDNLEKTMLEQQQKSSKDVSDKEKDREKRLKDYQSDLSALRLDISAKKVDIEGVSLQEEALLKSLEDFEAYSVIAAPGDGVVTALPVSKGEAVSDNKLMATIGLGETFEIECTIPLDNNFVSVGDKCALSNASHALDGVVSKLVSSAQGKLVTIFVDTNEVSAGDTFDIEFKRESTLSYTLVPNGALNQDNDGYFLYQIKRRDGILGKEFYLKRLDVFIGDSDSKNTAITEGITFFEPIMLLCDQSVSDGGVVALENASDFFKD